MLSRKTLRRGDRQGKPFGKHTGLEEAQLPPHRRKSGGHASSRQGGGATMKARGGFLLISIAIHPSVALCNHTSRRPSQSHFLPPFMIAITLPVALRNCDRPSRSQSPFTIAIALSARSRVVPWIIKNIILMSCVFLVSLLFYESVNCPISRFVFSRSSFWKMLTTWMQMSLLGSCKLDKLPSYNFLHCRLKQRIQLVDVHIFIWWVLEKHSGNALLRVNQPPRIQSFNHVQILMSLCHCQKAG